MDHFSREVCIVVVLCQFSNNRPVSDSVDDAIAFLIMPNSTCTGQFSGDIAFMSVLDFGPRKNIHLI